MPTARQGQGQGERMMDAIEDDPAYAAARERVQHATAQGEYEELLAPGMWRLFDAAAAERGLSAEIGALRLAMARLIAEERDPRQLATHLARVAAVTMRAVHMHQRVASADDDPLRAALLDALERADDRESGVGEWG